MYETDKMYYLHMDICYLFNANNDAISVNNSFALGQVDKLDMVFCLFVMCAFDFLCLSIIMY